MKTLEEIKQQLGSEIPVHYHLPNPEPRLHPTELMKMQALHACSLVYIQALEARCDRYEQEKQSLLHDVLHVIPLEFCEACAHEQEEARCEEHDFDCEKCPEKCPCKNCHDGYSNFKWRGVCSENTKEE